MSVIQLTLWANAPQALAACVPTGHSIVCTEMDSKGIQLGPEADGYTITVEAGSLVSSSDANGISVGSDTDITINGQVTSYATSSSGLYDQRANTIEGASLNTITIGSAGEVLAQGSDAKAAAIKMMGYGNVITNRGTIKATTSSAVWFLNDQLEDTVLNQLINYGSISSASSGSVAIGSDDGLGVILGNYGAITGGINFGNGNDSLTFYDGSKLTGNISAGGGNNSLTFNSGSTLTGNISTGDDNDTFTFNHNVTFSGNINAGKGQNTLTLINAGTSNNIEVDALAADMTGITDIIKQGIGRWNLTGAQVEAKDVTGDRGLRNVTVEQGILNLAGSISQFYGQAVINPNYGTAGSDPTATLEASTQNLPVWDPKVTTTTGPKIINNGILRFVQTDGGTYENVISGSGKVEKTGAGRTVLSAENTYAGGTTVTEGILAITRDKALGQVSGGLTLNGVTAELEFAADNFTLDTNRSLTMGENGGTINTGTYTVALNQAIDGPGSLAKKGGGILQLTKINTYSGGTIINDGTLAIAQDRNLGAASGGLTFGDNGTLRLDADNIVLAATRTVEVKGTGVIDTQAKTGSEVASTIIGEGTLVKKGDGTLLLSGDNTFSGATEIEAGELRAGSSGAFSSASLFDIGVDGTLNLAGLDQSIGGLAGEGTVQLGSQKLSINQAADSTFSGTINGAAGGTLSKSGGGGLILTRDLAVNLNLEVNGDNGYLGLQRNGDLNLQNKLTGDGTLLIDLAGHDLTLDQAGVGTNFVGTLDIQNTNLVIDNAAEAVLAGASLELSADSEAKLEADRTIGGLIFDGGTLNADGQILTVNTLEVKSGGTVKIDPSALSSQIDQNKNIFDYADGAAQVAVVKANSVTGQGGQLNVRDENGDPIGQGTSKEISGGKIYFDVTASVEDSSTRKGLYVGYGPSQVEAYAGQNVTLDSSSATSADPRLTAKLTGSGGFIFQGDQGVQAGNSGSSYTGATTIDRLRVTAIADKAFGDTSLLNLINGGSVDLNGNSLTVGGLTGTASSEIILGALGNTKGLTVNQAGDQTYNGNLSGYGGFTKSGAGTLTLSGLSNYTGPTTVNQGTLKAGSATAFNQNQAWQVGGGRVDLNGYNLTVSQLSGSNYNGQILLTNQAGLTVNQSANTDYRGGISGDGSLTKTGSGTLNLLGRNDYSGRTILNSGTLAAGSDNALSSASVHVINDAATLNLGGFSQTVAGLEGTSTGARVLMSSGESLTIDSATDHSYDGRITGDGSLVKSGVGQQVLTNGQNSFTGGLEVKQGSVKLTTAKAAGSGDLSVKAGASLIVDNSANESMTNALSGRGTFIKSNSGKLDLAGQVDLGTIEVRGGLMSLADTLAAEEIIISAGAGLSAETLLFTGRRTLDLTGVQGNFSYNNLEVRGRDNQVLGGLASAAGKGLHFVLPADIKAGEVMLKMNGQALNITDATLSLEAGGYLRQLAGGDQIVLIDSTSGTIAEAGQSYQALYGATSYNFEVDRGGDQLAINYQGRSGDTSKAKSYLEAPLAGLALTASHGRLVVDLASRQIIERTENGVGVLAGVTASQHRVDTGSHADINGFSYMVGPAWRFDNLSGVSRLGVFVEGGNGDYDAFNRTANRRVKSSGDIDQIGGVIFGRHDFQDNYYMEGSVRLGRVETDYKTHDLGTRASFDSSSLYWGAHVGGGYMYSIDEQSLVQPYLNVYFTRQTSDDLTTKAGERVKLETADSVVTRLGARYSRALTETVTARVGAAWDQELDGKQDGTIDGLKIPNPSMKGASAFGEIGLSYQPTDAPYFIEINAFGNAGKIDGGGGQAAVGITF